MDLSQYLQMFIEESKDNLQNLNENLLKLETAPHDMQILNEIFRVAHTLKGMAGTMGFVKMQKLTHNIENVLSEIRNDRITVNSNMLDVLFKCLDALENYVEEIVSTGSEGNETYEQLIAELEDLAKGTFSGSKMQSVSTGGAEAQAKEKEADAIALPEAQQNAIAKALNMNMNVFQIKIKLSAACVLKSARAFVIFTQLEKFGDIIHAVPSVQDIEDEKFDDIFTIIIVTHKTAEDIKETIMGVAEVETVQVDSIEFSEQEHNYGETSENIQEQESQEQSSDNLKQQPAKQQVSGKTVRVNIDRLDKLMNLVSELIIIKTQLEGLDIKEAESISNYNDSVEYLERITTNLHDAVMKVRMVPIEIVFNRFPRMIRDVSRSLNKDIDLVMSGEETELDRSVIDEIGDPLIHLLRNAADHGIETTEERIKLGKPPKGTIKLMAYQDGNSVVIEVRDDGRGIDAKAIKHKALDKGIITPEEAASMSEQEIIDLLFRPSFSTADKITDLSGRGVGLDVVKSKITSLGGHVEVKTQLGQGSQFIVRLPLTLAIIQALMIKIGNEKYAIPLNTIQNIEDVRKEDIRLVEKQEVIVVRNQIIPIVRLHSLLGIPNEDKDTMMGVIVKKGEKQVGFIIDSLIGQQEIVIKSLGKYLSGIDMIAGATILGNGEVALILDVNTLI